MKVVKVCSCKKCFDGMLACKKCGQSVCKANVEKRRSRKKDNPEWCSACLAKPVARISYMHSVLGEIWCIPHVGDVNDDLYPVDALGELYKPGERICGHKDCVNSQHVVASKKVVLPADLFSEV
jgi:hypothetical protein